MAIYVKCSSCGEIFNELLNSKCPNCGCEEVIKMHYEDNRLVEGDCKNIKTYSDSIVEQPVNSEKQAEQPDNSEYIPKTPFPYTEVPILFASVYEFFFKKDKEIKFWRILLIMFIELLIGIALVAIGYYISLEFEERAHRLGVNSRGGSRGGALFMFMGVAAFAHSFYSLVKYTTLCIIAKKESLMSEKKVRLILFTTECLLGGLIIAIDALISQSPEWIGDTEETVTFAIGVIGFGLIIGAVVSLIKYYIKKQRQ